MNCQDVINIHQLYDQSINVYIYTYIYIYQNDHTCHEIMKSFMIIHDHS